MGLTDNYTGIGMSPRPTREHQRVMAKLYHGLFTDLYEDEYEVLTEWVLDPNNLNAKAPDIVVYSINKNLPVMFIEITNTKEAKNIEKEIVKAMQVYNVPDAFMYDYEKDTWYCYGSSCSEKKAYWELQEIFMDEYL